MYWIYDEHDENSLHFEATKEGLEKWLSDIPEDERDGITVINGPQITLSSLNLK
jgi:hypothetical protein